ncbi:hypothetical protein D5R40_17655 [Okeania hirsuta]|uniref:Uncharacterized protein n=1 Tax=Okeania hirsuta TaxID=1458930 RepID=A0A3N6N2Q6_9CYAN|nr:hypothetical protein D4Z78_27800 [Okeania hirsuta]RQH38459.1 hypothetical protein D5R40_17655 [Okeania hirsuta]
MGIVKTCHCFYKLQQACKHRVDYGELNPKKKIIIQIINVIARGINIDVNLERKVLIPLWQSPGGTI